MVFTIRIHNNAKQKWTLKQRELILNPDIIKFLRNISKTVQATKKPVYSIYTGTYNSLKILNNVFFLD